MKYFQNKTIWITGASSGIGEELSKRLSEYCQTLIISARRVDELQRVAKEVTGKAEIIIAPMDLEDTNKIPEIVSEVLTKVSKVDILFNNGGISQRANAFETSLTINRRIMEVNYFGNITLSKSLLSSMRDSKGGHIVVTSSVAGKFGFFLRSAYSASKHALHGYYESLRLEEYDNNIKVTMLCPGAVNTMMSNNAITSSGKSLGKKDRMQKEGLTVEECVTKILHSVAKGKEEIVFGKKEKYGVLIKRFLPGIFTSVMRKQKPVD